MEQTKLYRNNCRSAGGIIIDPWTNIHNPDKYNILVIKQRLGENWGLPKGHCEQGEDIEECALREIKEETGYDFSELKEGHDYLKIDLRGKNNYNHHKIKIKKISFFMFVLLKRGNCVQKYKRDYDEIKDLAWINIPRLRRLCVGDHHNFKCNRTLTLNSSILLEKICQTAYHLLSNY